MKESCLWEITLHEINILVPKGINKDSELGSVQGTQGMTTAWIFATTVAGFLGFRTILLPYSQVQYTVYDNFLCIINILITVHLLGLFSKQVILSLKTFPISLLTCPAC